MTVFDGVGNSRLYDNSGFTSIVYDSVNDRVLVNKLSYKLHDPRRGDVVVLKRIETNSQERDLIKRVVGLPGDTITTDCTYSEPQTFGEGTAQEMCYLFTMAYPKGALVDDGTVFRHAGDHLWVMTNGTTFADHLASATPGMAVTVENRLHEMPLISVQGPRSRELLRSITDADVDAKLTEVRDSVGHLTVLPSAGLGLSYRY